MNGDVFGDAARCLLNGQSIPFFFGPDEGLVLVNPCSAKFNRAALVFDAVRASTKAITGFKNHRPHSPLLEVACSGKTRQSTTIDDNIQLVGHLTPGLNCEIEPCRFGLSFTRQ